MKSVADVERETKAALGSKDRVKALVEFERSPERMLTVVEIGTLTADDPPREARKAWIPVEVQVLTPPLAERLGLKGKTGVRVTRLLDPATPLHLGDIILAIDGDPVRATAPTDDDLFASEIRRYRVGASVKLTINRDGTEMPLPVTLGQTPTQPREMKWYADPVFEFRARDVAEADREDPRVANAQRRARRVRGRARLGVARAAERRRSDPVDRRSAGGGRRRAQDPHDRHRGAQARVDRLRDPARHPHDVHRNPAGVEVGPGPQG